MSETTDNLLPCPFCGGKVSLVENYMRQYPTMSGTRTAPQLLSVEVVHNCPRLTDTQGNYPVLASHIQVRGRDHAATIAAWNGRAK